MPSWHKEGMTTYQLKMKAGTDQPTENVSAVLNRTRRSLLNCLHRTCAEQAGQSRERPEQGGGCIKGVEIVCRLLVTRQVAEKLDMSR